MPSRITDIIYNNPKLGTQMKFKTETGNPDVIEKMLLSYKTIFNDHDIYEFGTYLGSSICGITSYLDHHNISIHSFVGFDSLEGLPEETMDKNNNPHWKKGEYSIKKIHNKDISVDEYKQYLVNNNRLPTSYLSKFVFFKGFYNKTLNESIIDQLKPPLLINIDCDIYTSTAQVLEFIFKNKMYVKNKTIIRYDDWANKNQEYQTGQSLAHKDMTEKYNVTCELLLKHSHNKNPEATWWLIK